MQDYFALEQIYLMRLVPFSIASMLAPCDFLGVEDLVICSAFYQREETF